MALLAASWHKSFSPGVSLQLLCANESGFWARPNRPLPEHQRHADGQDLHAGDERDARGPSAQVPEIPRYGRAQTAAHIVKRCVQTYSEGPAVFRGSTHEVVRRRGG